MQINTDADNPDADVASHGANTLTAAVGFSAIFSRPAVRGLPAPRQLPCPARSAALLRCCRRQTELQTRAAHFESEARTPMLGSSARVLQLGSAAPLSSAARLRSSGSGSACRVPHVELTARVRSSCPQFGPTARVHSSVPQLVSTARTHSSCPQLGSTVPLLCGGG